MRIVCESSSEKNAKKIIDYFYEKYQSTWHNGKNFKYANLDAKYFLAYTDTKNVTYTHIYVKGPNDINETDLALNSFGSHRTLGLPHGN